MIRDNRHFKKRSWLLRYRNRIKYWNIFIAREQYIKDYKLNMPWQFLNNVIIFKPKAPLRQAKATLTDFGYSVLALWYSCSQKTCLALLSFDLWILFEKRVECEIRYLRFYLKKVLIRNNCFRLNLNPIPCLFFRSSYTFGLSCFPNDS